MLQSLVFVLTLVSVQLPLNSQAFSVNVVSKLSLQARTNFLSNAKESLIIPPPLSKRNKQQTSIILLPGCQLTPRQYENVAKAIQQSSDQAVWIAIPKFPLDVANPLVVPSAVKSALEELQKQGYKGEKTFVGGHSLGGVFLPSVFDEPGLKEEQVSGTIKLGCFQARDTPKDSSLKALPSLTLTGELDGMIRASRIAEDYHRNVLSCKQGNSEETKLHHAVVLVEGMNHFGFVQGHAPFMKQLRDLTQEITYKESVMQVGSAIAAFIDVHQDLQPRMRQSRFFWRRFTLLLTIYSL